MSLNVVSPGTAQIHVGADFTEDETEFVMAMERYRRVKRRRFPSFREVLQVLKSLGYRKQEIVVRDQESEVKSLSSPLGNISM